MLKQSPKNDDPALRQAQDDIQFLLSNIRSRENGLIFFLESFTSQCRTREQYGIFKEQFLQKEKIYANQVSKIISKYSRQHDNQHILQQFLRTFWIKVKSIIKISLERLRTLELLNERIFSRYEQIIGVINNYYDEGKDLEYFNNVQILLKKRNVDALIHGRDQFTTHNSDSKINKNRSESAFKNHKGSPKPCKQQPDMPEVEQLHFGQNSKDQQNRLKSLNRYRKKKIILQSGKNSSSKTQQKLYKKISKSIEKYQKNLEGAMDCIIDINIDKKKTIKQNQQSIYDQLFNRNIPNHKRISKFIFGACGIAKLLMGRKNLKAKRVIVGKVGKSGPGGKELEKRNKSKQLKQHKQRGHEPEKQRPQSSITVQISNIFEEERKKMIQSTLALHHKKHSKYHRQIGTRLQKYSKMVRLIS